MIYRGNHMVNVVNFSAGTTPPTKGGERGFVSEGGQCRGGASTGEGVARAAGEPGTQQVSLAFK